MEALPLGPYVAVGPANTAEPLREALRLNAAVEAEQPTLPLADSLLFLHPQWEPTAGEEYTDS